MQPMVICDLLQYVDFPQSHRWSNKIALASFLGLSRKLTKVIYDHRLNLTFAGWQEVA